MKRVEIFDRTKDSKSCVEVMDDLLHCVWCKMLAPCLTLSYASWGVASCMARKDLTVHAVHCLQYVIE